MCYARTAFSTDEDYAVLGFFAVKPDWGACVAH